MTKGQQAMTVAMIYPEPEKGGRGKNRNEKLQFSKMHLSRARTVLRHTPDAAPLVLSGAMSLDAGIANETQRRLRFR